MPAPAIAWASLAASAITPIILSLISNNKKKQPYRKSKTVKKYTSYKSKPPPKYKKSTKFRTSDGISF